VRITQAARAADHRGPRGHPAWRVRGSGGLRRLRRQRRPGDRHPVRADQGRHRVRPGGRRDRGGLGGSLRGRGVRQQGAGGPARGRRGGDPAAGDGGATMTQRARILVPVVLLLVSAVLLWIASRVVWLDVVAFNDQAGESRRALLGTDWQPALVPLALGSVAAVAAVSLARGPGSRVVGAVIALLGIAAGGLMESGLSEPDETRAHAVITSADDVGRTNASPAVEGSQGVPEWSVVTGLTVHPRGAVLTSAASVGRTNAGPGVGGSQSVPEWSVVTGMTVHPLGGVLTGAGAVTLLVAGAFGMIRPARRVRQDARFVTPAARREAARAGTAAGGGGPEPGAAPSDGAPEGPARDLWQEVDEGRDPTE